MKVCFLNTYDQKGGAARACYRNFLTLQGDIEVTLLVLEKLGHHPRVHEVKELLTFWERIGMFLRRPFFERKQDKRWQRYPQRQPVMISDISYSQVGPAISRLDADILHLNWVAENFIDFKELTAFKGPIVWTLHDSHAFTAICHHLNCERFTNHCGTCPILGEKDEQDESFHIFKEKINRYANLDLHIVALSRAMADNVKKSRLLGDRPVHLIPNCIDTDLFSPSSNPDNSSCWRGGYVMRIGFSAINLSKDPYKGFGYFEKALHLIRKWEPELKLEIVLIGEDGLDYGDLPFDVHQVGRVDDDQKMAQLYDNMDLLVLPSMVETLSNTIMEAMSCGTPVVAFDVGGNADLVDHLENGYLAHPLEIEDLTRGIKWCLEHHPKSLGAKAREKVKSCFSKESVKQKLINLYQHILDDNCKHGSTP